MKKILITGANGYLGGQLCSSLLNGKNMVTGLFRSDKITAFDNSPGFKKVTGDIRDKQLLNNLVKEKFDLVIHLVSLDQHMSKQDIDLVTSINVTPTWHLLDIFSKAGLPHFIYFSTTQVYGNMGDAVVDEQAEIRLLNAYALTHYLSENICSHFNTVSATACTVLRLSNSYGQPSNYDNASFSLVVNDLCLSAFEKHQITLQSDGSPKRDFIHGNDVCNAIGLLVSKATKVQQKDLYNVSSGQTYSILEVAQKVKEIFLKRYNKDITIFTSNGANPAATAANSRFVVSNNKLKNLGFEPQMSLEEGINSLFDYLEKNRGLS